MIVKLTEKADIEKVKQTYLFSHVVFWESATYLVTPSSMKEILIPEEWVAEVWVFENDIQLASRRFYQPTRKISLKDVFTTASDEMIIIAGPCSVENEEMIEMSASFIREMGLKAFRAGSYKPRTSPYSFQGLGMEGLKLLNKIKEKYGLLIVTEVRDACHVAEVAQVADVVQVGAKAMYDQGILVSLGRTQKPVLLKRHFGATLQEFAQAAEYILSAGNPNVILCERGIRTFETKTRFTLDLTGVAWLKEHVNLPIVLDPSHAMGHAFGVPDLAKACVALGVDGLLIEVHPSPSQALSDAKQQLSHEEFKALLPSLRSIAQAIGKRLV